MPMMQEGGMPSNEMEGMMMMQGGAPQSEMPEMEGMPMMQGEMPVMEGIPMMQEGEISPEMMELAQYIAELEPESQEGVIESLTPEEKSAVMQILGISDQPE